MSDGHPSRFQTPPRPSLSRPQFPWTAYAHNHRPSSSSSSFSTTSLPAAVNSGTNWEAGSSTSTASAPALPSVINWPHVVRQSPAPSQPSIVPSDEAMRHWTFTAFEWTVRNVRSLRDFLERPLPVAEGESAALEMPEVLKESPIIGDGKFKLEIGRSTLPEDRQQQPQQSAGNPANDQNNLGQSLSLCVTCLTLDFAPADYEASASMMAAIRCQNDRVGERGARPEWPWEFWEDWVFRKESEFWECTLPSLSALLENPRIAEADSFVICVQIHSPVGPLFPQHPSAYYVPKDLLDGLEASLDNPNTGDVKFVCLERLTNPSTPQLETADSPASSAYLSPFPYSTARKRVIYAHSDILIRRSEYFATMLASSFSETTAHSPGDRKMHTIVVEEADFVTVYWLLKWVYANYLVFKEVDDPRAAVRGLGAGWSARWISGGGGEWEWKTMNRGSGSWEDGSVASAGEGEGKGKDQAQSSASTDDSVASSRGSRPSKGLQSATPVVSPSATRVDPPPIRRHTSPRGTVAATTSKPSAVVLQSGRFPIQSRLPARPSLTPDPHPHPTPLPPPASALSVYQIAHRYTMPGLSALALEHMMNTIEPRTSFPLLLASCFWEDLHALVEDFVVDRWDVVSQSEEFEQCCQEVASGDWGPEGGKTLARLFRRLLSPNAVRYARV